MGQYLRLFSRFILRPLGRQKLRSAITALGISLGVGVMVAVRLANATSLESFRAATEPLAGNTSLTISGAGGRLDELDMSEISWLREYAALSPVVEGLAYAPRADQPDLPGVAVKGDFLHVLGVDVLRDHPLRRHRLVRFMTGNREPGYRELLFLLSDSKAVALTERFARRRGIKIGDTIPVIIGGNRSDLIVRALLADEGFARSFDGRIALMDIAAAQWALDRIGYLDRVDLKLKPGVPIDVAEQEINSRLPARLAVRRPDYSFGQVEKMIAAFHFNLNALAAISVLVGLFLIYNTVSISVIARRDEIGMLRALGGSRKMVLSLFFGEAVLLSLVGSAAGLGLGRLLAGAATQASAATVNTFYIAWAARGALAAHPLRATDLLLALAVALPLSIVAAAVPALEASRVRPVEAMRGAERLGADLRLSRTHLSTALLLMGSAYPLSLLGPVNGVPLFGYAAAAALTFGGAFLVPPSLWTVCRLVCAGSRRNRFPLRAEARLAGANLGGAIRRVSISVAALAVSLAMMVAISIMIGSFRETVVYWINQNLWASVYVRSVTGQLNSVEDISEDVVSLIRSDPDVAEVYPFTARELNYGASPITIGAGDFKVFSRIGKLLYKSPANASRQIEGAIGQDSIVVSESFELRFEKKVGDQVLLPTIAGPHPFKVVAVYYDYSSSRGTVVMDSRTYERWFGPFRPGSLSLVLREGAAPEAVVERLSGVCGPERGIAYTTSGAVRGEVMRIFDSSFTIIRALEIVAIVVAALGVIATLITLILERRREIAILRCLGATASQVRRTILIEAAMIGSVGQGIGVAAGAAMSLVIIYVINTQSFAWTLQFHLPVGFLLQTTLLIVAVSAVAGLYPAARGASIDPIRFVREE
jgi:putative ABC transport system permease protein